MEEYTPMILPGWSNTPRKNEGHINDYLPGSKYGNDSKSWEKAEKNNDFISLFTVCNSKNLGCYKIVYTQDPENPVYVPWNQPDQRFGYDILDREAAEIIIIEIQSRIDKTT